MWAEDPSLMQGGRGGLHWQQPPTNTQLSHGSPWPMSQAGMVPMGGMQSSDSTHWQMPPPQGLPNFMMGPAEGGPLPPYMMGWDATTSWESMGGMGPGMGPSMIGGPGGSDGMCSGSVAVKERKMLIHQPPPNYKWDAAAVAQVRLRGRPREG